MVVHAASFIYHVFIHVEHSNQVMWVAVAVCAAKQLGFGVYIVVDVSLSLIIPHSNSSVVNKNGFDIVLYLLRQSFKTIKY
jgi:hypothetical protein